LQNLLTQKPLIFISICSLIIWLLYEINKRLYNRLSGYN
ncbi:MAG: DUF1361 domain-containing protein, partial [Microcystis panniformis]